MRGPADENRREIAAEPAWAGSAEPRSNPSESGHDFDLTRERELLESARHDMTEDRFEGALQKIERHLREYPSGRLAPEREALAVQALVVAGRYDDARRRGAEFAERFPRSMFRAAVESTLRSIR
jgi:outer membrane protein assembly factor BamD (BamD/ComL family)